MKTTLLATITALTLVFAGTAFAKSGAHDTSVNSANSLPPGFNDGNLTYQTFQRLRREAMEHEKAVLAERARQQPNTIGATPPPRLAAAEATDAVDDD